LSDQCKLPGEEHQFAFDRFKAGECVDCKHRHECRFVSYIRKTRQYGPFNCAGENIAGQTRTK